MSNSENSNEEEYDRGINHMIEQFHKTEEGSSLTVDFPKNLMIEITNACNLRCVMCYNRLMKRKKGFMDEETFQLVLNNAKKIGIEMIGLYTTGEPFLHPKIYDIIKLAKRMGFRYVYITSNGVLLDKDRIDRIFESGLDSIKFSIDAASRETYDKLRPGGDFDRVFSNVKMLRERRDKLNSKLRIFASFVVTNKNQEELEQFRELCKDLIDEVSIAFVSNQSGLQKEEFQDLVINNVENRMVRTKNICPLLWDRIIVTYDGKYTICSEDFEGALIYGDIHDEPMKDAWNNDKIRAYRKMFQNEDFNLSPRCKDCGSNLNDAEIMETLYK